MLLQLSRRCEESCLHCFANSTKDGPLMNRQTINAFIEFMKTLPPAKLKWLTGNEIDTPIRRIVISGGEPIEHPELKYLIQDLSEAIPDIAIIIESNGMWVEDDSLVEIVEMLLDYDTVKMMVCGAHKELSSHYNRYNLLRDKLLDVAERVAKQDNTAAKLIGDTTPPSSKLIIDMDWINVNNVLPLGRAKDNSISKTQSTPPCFSSFILAQECKTFSEFLAKLEIRGNYVTPMITVDGDVVMGPNMQCLKLGSILDSTVDEMYHKLINMTPCDICGLNTNIPEKDLLGLIQQQKYRI